MTLDAGYRVSPLDPDDARRLGPYRLTGRLGSGGMGVVYLATDPRGRYVAVKLVHARLADDPEFRGRFRSEVERARQVPSFCTAEVLDADLDHEPPYLVVEYVDGPSLAEEVDDNGPLTSANLHSVAVGVATALTGIHGAGVIHRDLKPENVLLAPGSPKVIDFGIARAFEAATSHTRTDQMVGTVAYMAPERITSDPETPLSAAADVFAWGCVVAYAGTGRTPFHGDSPASTAARILTQPPQLGALEEPLRSLVRLTLAKEPQDRPTARELLDLLVDGPPAPLPPPIPRAPEPVYVGVSPRRRGRSSRLLPALAVLLMLAGVGTVFGVLRRGTPARDLTAAVATPAPPVRQGPVLPAASTAAPAPSKHTPSRRPPVAQPRPSGDPIVRDTLAQPGQWRNTIGRDLKSRCTVRNGLQASRVAVGRFQCSGPARQIEDDFTVAVTTALQTQGACASIWLHWDDADGGQVVRLCQDRVDLAEDTPDRTDIVSTLTMDRPVALRQANRVRLGVQDGGVDVWLGDQHLGRLQLPDDSANDGQVKLGVTVVAQPVLPPYAVTFADVDIREL